MTHFNEVHMEVNNIVKSTALKRNSMRVATFKELHQCNAVLPDVGTQQHPRYNFLPSCPESCTLSAKCDC